MSNLVIRDLAEADLGAVAALIRALNDSEGYDPRLSPAARDVGKAFLGEGRTGRFLVAESGTALIGYVTFHTTYETTYASRGAYVGDLFVQDAHRRRGVGRRLLGAVASAVRRDGGAHLWWTALPKNAAGQAFYARLGAKPETIIVYALAEAAFATIAADHAP